MNANLLEDECAAEIQKVGTR
ncbi:unnamed protein product [Victoria cruziana]